MALENKTVLENLIKQRDEVAQQLETARVTLFKLEGAIDVLTQIEESAKEESEGEATVAETEVVSE
tara:strand:- start:816 stop:1013 length:198 start_codon:yes stop_codon:yes gene_type:complete